MTHAILIATFFFVLFFAFTRKFKKQSFTSRTILAYFLTVLFYIVLFILGRTIFQGSSSEDVLFAWFISLFYVVIFGPVVVFVVFLVEWLFAKKSR